MTLSISTACSRQKHWEALRLSEGSQIPMVLIKISVIKICQHHGTPWEMRRFEGQAGTESRGSDSTRFIHWN